jgi:hypothetical protein
VTDNTGGRRTLVWFPFQQLGHACSLRGRARGGLVDAVSSRSSGSDMSRRLGWCGVRWIFRVFVAGLRLGLSRLVSVWGFRGCMGGGYSAERFLTMRTLRIPRRSVNLRVPIDPVRSPMPRNWLLPAPPARLCAPLLDVCSSLDLGLRT